MKKYSISCLLIILSCLSSCSLLGDTSPIETSVITSAAPAPIKMSAELSAIADVIQNKKEYYCTVYGRNIYLKDFHARSCMSYETNEYDNDEYNNTNHVYGRFCVIDLDEDRIPELILESETTFGNELVFHYEDGVVYGYVFPYRGFKMIKKDGSFSGSGSAAHGNTGKIKFSKDKVLYTELCFIDGMSKEYRINGKDVSRKEAGEYRKKQHKKKDAKWYPYDEMDFEKYFVS